MNYIPLTPGLLCPFVMNMYSILYLLFYLEDPTRADLDITPSCQALWPTADRKLSSRDRTDDGKSGLSSFQWVTLNPEGIETGIHLFIWI